VFLVGEPDRRVAEIDRCGNARDVAGIAHLEAVQCLGRVRHLLGDPEIVIEKIDQTVEPHLRHRKYSIAAGP
jgi:hypothetical protein